MSNEVNVSYQYKNSELGTTKLWLAWPEKRGRNLQTNREPIAITSLFDDSLAFFELKAGEELVVSWTVEDYLPRKEELSAEKKSFYLRSTVLCPITEENEKIAREKTAGAESDREKAEMLFHYLVEQFTYVYPPQSRGAVDFLRDKKGDCGEYSFLYAALCRSLGIPCRTIVGSWSGGKMQAHVWNEVYLDGGWLPVDASMAFIQKKKKLQFMMSDVKTLPWQKYFGHTEGQRIIFSHDAEIPLTPAYDEAEPEKLDSGHPASFFQIRNKPFFWGYCSLDGAAPYLQPAYVRFNDQNLEQGRKPNDASYLGTWGVKETGFRRFAFLMKRISFAVVLFTVLLDLFIESRELELVKGIALILAGGSFLVRKERPLLYGFLTFLFVLGFLSVAANG